MINDSDEHRDRLRAEYAENRRSIAADLLARMVSSDLYARFDYAERATFAVQQTDALLAELSKTE
jgi:hypothetical protein